MPSDPQGLYRLVRDGGRTKLVWVEYPDKRNPMEMPESMYRERGYLPPFEELPTREVYEAARSKADSEPDRPKTT